MESAILDDPCFASYAMSSENKRQSTVKVPVALPKTDGAQSPAQMIPQEAALYAAVGSR